MLVVLEILAIIGGIILLLLVSWHVGKKQYERLQKFKREE